MAETPIIPVKQTNITLAGTSFIAVLLPTGATGLVLPQLCEFLGLNTNDQAQRLRFHPTLSEALVLVEIKTAGGPQVTNVLLSWGILLWLERIRRGRRAKVYQERLLILQHDAAVELSKPFFQNVTEEPSTPKRKKPAARTEKPPSVLEAIQALQQGMQTLYDAVVAEKQEQQSLEARVRRLEGRAAPAQAAPTDSRALVGWAPLAAEQQRILLGWLHEVQRQTGVPLKTLALEVADYCGADRLAAIPQAAWPEAVAWVTGRLHLH
jgi:hypothetical protein